MPAATAADWTSAVGGRYKQAKDVVQHLGKGTVMASIDLWPSVAISILALSVTQESRSASAATSGASYDMSRFLSEPHPFDRPFQPSATPPPPSLARPAAPSPAVSQPDPPRPPIVAATAPPGLPTGPTAVRPPSSVAQATSRPAVPARATPDAKDAERWHIFSELRGGLLAHDVGPFSRQKEDGVDVNVEILFGSPRFMELIWSPRPTVGATINTSGDTSQGYLGLTWEWDFWEQAYVSFFWGASAHNGEKTVNLTDKKDLGCSVLFREGLDLGWRFTEQHSVMAHFSHISNAKLCDPNEGLETIGVRYGYRF